MAQADEAALAKGRLAAPLAAGLESLDQNQQIIFTKYTKVVLPLDGFIFWVRSEILIEAAAANSTLLGSSTIATPIFGQSGINSNAPQTLTIKGSLHYATDSIQEEDEVFDKDRVIFTSLEKVDNFNDLGPNEMYLGTFNGLRFSWSRRDNFYKQADLYHYSGDAVYPVMESQIIDSPLDLDPSLIVSNSLPIWLAMNNFVKQPWDLFGNQGITLYPSYLAEENIVPPFGTVHISNTNSLQMAPLIDPANASHTQLCEEKARITLYGYNNAQAMNFIDFVNQQSLAENLFGISSWSTINDEKKTQNEIFVIAKKKSFEVSLTYNQASSRALAQKLISQVIVDYEISNF